MLYVFKGKEESKIGGVTYWVRKAEKYITRRVAPGTRMTNGHTHYFDGNLTDIPDLPQCYRRWYMLP